jgi:hypothetical protein
MTKTMDKDDYHHFHAVTRLTVLDRVVCAVFLFLLKRGINV